MSSAENDRRGAGGVSRLTTAEAKQRLRAWGPVADADLDAFMQRSMTDITGAASKLISSMSLVTMGLGLARTIFGRRTERPSRGLFGIVAGLAAQAAPLIIKALNKKA